MLASTPYLIREHNKPGQKNKRNNIDRSYEECDAKRLEGLHEVCTTYEYSSYLAYIYSIYMQTKPYIIYHLLSRDASCTLCNSEIMGFVS